MGSTQKEVNEQIDANPNADKRLFERQLKRHKVLLDEFRISRYPITNKQFSEFVSSSNYTTTAEEEGFGMHFAGEMKKVKGADWKHPHGPESSIGNKMNHPVVMVSWFDALKFCKWLSKETRKHWSLPTEAQWEKTARGPEGNLWPWGNTWDETRCNCNNLIGDTTPVGMISPKGDSFYGCSDMAGNVLEWTTTTIGIKDPWPVTTQVQTPSFEPKFKYYRYPYKPNDGRENLKSNARRVARGGTFQRGKDMCRCAFRFADMPGERYSSMGFRVVEIPNTL